jgi:hypothetical protein
MRFQHMITEPAEVALHRCGAMILTGTAEGLPAKADPIALNSAGHVAAILGGHEVYRLTNSGLVHIDSTRIMAAIHGPLLPDHKCGRVWPPEYLAPSIPAQNTAEYEGFPF